MSSRKAKRKNPSGTVSFLSMLLKKIYKLIQSSKGHYWPEYMPKTRKFTKKPLLNNSNKTSMGRALPNNLTCQNDNKGFKNKKKKNLRNWITALSPIWNNSNNFSSSVAKKPLNNFKKNILSWKEKRSNKNKKKGIKTCSNYKRYWKKKSTKRYKRTGEWRRKNKPICKTKE